MSIELPNELVWVMSMLGLDWPQIDEDTLRDYAGELRTFGSSIADTHGQAGAAVNGLSADSSGPSYEALVERWAQASSAHIQELIDICDTCAVALEVAADGVIAAKVGIIAALVAMAAEFVADQAAAIFTFGLAEAAEAGIVTATRFIVKAALDQLEQEVIGTVLQAVLGPLEDKVAAAIEGLAYKAVEAALS
jgi:hypothetical protein